MHYEILKYTVPMKQLIYTTKLWTNLCYAIAIEQVEKDITADLKDTLSPAQPKNFASIKDPKEISLLLKNIEAYYKGLVVRIAFAQPLFVRQGELRHAQQNEFDFEK